MLINGNWITTNEEINVINPSTKEVYKSVYKSGKEETISAIEAAENAREEWAELPAVNRAQVLEMIAEKVEENKEHLAKVITEEMGKPINNARSEVITTIDFFKWYAEETRRVYGDTIPASLPNKRLITVKQPIGVVAAITPWNFPLSMVAKKVAPALAAGCTVVIRPSSQAPVSAIELVKIIEQCDIPTGVVNLVVGDAREITGAIMDSPVVRKITFTGSTNVGKLLMKDASQTVKRVSMELGGNAPFIVFEDADLELAVDGAINAKFSSSGQQCVCANRIFVHENVYDQFQKMFVEKVAQIKVGTGLDEGSEVGPLINEGTLEEMDEFVNDATSKGANILYGGHQLTDGTFKDGYYYSPTVLSDVSEDMKVATDEIFGPIAPVMKFSDEDEVIAKANSVEFGLAAYFYTNDLSRMYRIYEKLEYAVIGVNDSRPSAVQGPFGGMKQSGIGREGGKGLDDYLEEKFVSIQIKE